MKGTLSGFVKLWILVNGTHSVVSAYTIPTGFYGSISDQRTPGFWGVTNILLKCAKELKQLDYYLEIEY